MYRQGLILLLSVSVHGAWTPGVGIPDPADYWSGNLDPVDSARPADPVEWPTSEKAAFYYVDNTHGSATDTANTYGYPDKPRLTMPTTLAAGAVVVIRGGPYAPSAYSVQWVGTSEAPIWISGDPDTRTEFQNTWRVREAGYLFIENIKWTNQGESQCDFRPNTTGLDVHHVAVRNCEVVGTGVAGGAGTLFGVAMAYDQVANDIVFYNCVGHDGGDWQSAVENDKHAFGLASNMTNIWWINCTAYHNGGDGFGNGHSADYTSHHLYWDGCVGSTNRENGIDLKEVHTLVVSGCTFNGYAPVSSSGGEAIITHYGPTSEEGTYNVFVLNCLIYDSSIGIITTDTGDSIAQTNLWYVGNVVRDCGIAFNGYGGGHLRLYGNTIDNCPEGITYSTIGKLTSANNIVSDSSSSHINMISADARSVSSSINECLSGGTVSISWGATYASVADWISGTTVGDSSIEQDPLFTNAATHDYTLTASSPCIGAGSSAAWTQLEADYLAVFGFALNYVDRAGNARVNDIGAYEYQAGSRRATMGGGARLSNGRF